MSKINVKSRSTLQTHEGALAKHITPLQALKRSVMSCLLWEKGFYEDGQKIAQRIKDLIPQVDPEAVSTLAIIARAQMNLRHVPLLIVREMARLSSRYKWYVRSTLREIIQRPDELTEFLAIYWEEKRQPLSAQVKKGLAEAFMKFNEYQLAKYNRDNAVKLRDVLFLTHAKPRDEEQAALWTRLVEDSLAIPDTWEVALSSGTDKREAWTRLLLEKKLGGLALLRNLRNMELVKVDRDLIKTSILKMITDRILPFRFIAAAKYAPSLEPELEATMFRNLAEHEKLPGRTVLLIDVSGSMFSPISQKSDLQMIDAACALSMLVREINQDCQVFSFSEKILSVPPRRGFALRDAILQSQSHSSTRLGAAVTYINQMIPHDRLIVFTDEQSHDSVPNPRVKKGYMINVGKDKNGVGYGPWIHIDGFSEQIVRYILELEKTIELK